MNRPINTHLNQQGAALVTALVLLTIVTLLAISSMGSNTLEEKMAANSQEVNRAFQTAETGLARVFANNGAFDTNNNIDDSGTPFDRSDDIYDFQSPADTNVGIYAAALEFTSAFRQQTVPKRGSGWDTTMAFYNFDLSATGTTGSGVSTTLHAGAYQVGKR